MADVFLSYSSKDRAAAERAQQALKAAGFDVFWDQETPAGQDWDTWIRGKLSTCKLAIVLWSRTSVKSDNVRHEALVARKAKKLLPAMIDPIEAEDLPMGLYMVQTTNLADWRDPNSKGIAKLVAEIEARLGRRTGGATPKQAAAPAAANPSSSANPIVMIAIAIALLGGGAWWFMSQQAPGAGPDSTPPIAASEQPSSRAAACLDNSIPNADGFCSNGVRPLPPAPALGSPDQLSRRIVGSWNWDGLACKDGPRITIDAGQLIFTTPQTRYVHTIESENDKEIRTRVANCTGCSLQQETNNSYVLKPEYFTTSDPDSRSFNLLVENLTRDTRDTWSPCKLN